MNGAFVVLPWLIAAAFVILCPLALAIWADDGPRNDDPPDTGGEPLTVLTTA